jgi:histidinol-phosphate aminotransferase
MTTMDPRARPVVRSLTPYQPGKPIEEVKRELGLRSVIKLASNENAFGPSPKAVAAMRRACASVHRYPDAGSFYLKAALAKHLKVDPSWLCAGNGSDELLVLALRAFVEPGEEVVVADPTFLIYALAATACDARVRRVPLKDLRYDLRAMRGAITSSTKVVFIANPDNPTGTYVTEAELRRFLTGLPAHVLVVLDEAYYEFADAPDYPQTIGWAAEHPLLITRTFSKAYGLAGLRVGYGVAQPPIIKALEAMREPFNVNSLAQAAAIAALGDRAFLAKTRRLTAEGKARLTRELAAVGLEVVPSQTNFLLVRVGPGAESLAQDLLRRGVIVRDMRAWKLEGYVRVTVGTEPENRRLVQALRAALDRGGRTSR